MAWLFPRNYCMRILNLAAGALFMLAAWPAGAVMTFESPLSGVPKTNWFIINFMDHGDGTTPLDYTSGRQTYPTHTGIDIMLYDFLTMDEGIDVVAAAPGTVIYYVDGLDDRLLENQPNRIFIRHGDGSVSYYAHLKMHSLLVSTGQVVALGEKIAELGANGTNDVAHLHFGVLDRWATNGVWCEIMTNQLGLSQSFDWFDDYTNQVIRQVYGMGITHSNDPVFTLPAWRQQQTPASYSVIKDGPFTVWIKYTGQGTNDWLNVRLLYLSGPGDTIDFSAAAWLPSRYLTYNCSLWESWWINATLVDGTTYKLQYRWNAEDWQDGPGCNTFTVDNDRQEVFLSRISLPAYSNAPAAPSGLTATAGTSADYVRLSWAPTANTVRYQVWRGTSDDDSMADLIMQTSNTGYDDMDAAAETLYYYWIAAVNAKGTSALSAAATGWRAEPAGIGPEVRINKYRCPPDITTAMPVTVTVQINPDIYAGIEADWWVAANTLLGWYYFAANQWLPWTGLLIPAYQGPLFNLPATTVLTHPGLPAGAYTFYFAVDLRDGRLDPSQAWIDAVPVYVWP